MKKKKKVSQPVYERKGIIKIEEVLDFVPIKNNLNGLKEKEYFGIMVRLTSPRYEVYAEKGTKCIKCSLEGVFFALEKSLSQTTKKFHFNLYAINLHEEEVMITVDHNIPKIKGGLDTIENKQPMCFICNNKKGDK